MRGIELSEQYWLEFGKPMIDADFSEISGRIAAGLVGEGSECFGYDDEISHDHDFEPSFCLWLTEKDEREFGFKLGRAYAKLPKEFMGFKRQTLSPVGGARRGVMTIASFYTKFLGRPCAPDSLEKWLYIPEHALASASNGKVFYDPSGEFTKIRDVLEKGYPGDVRLKKLAARTALMAQAGQYNYGRCIDRGETGAAQLAIFEFVRHTIGAIYLLNNAYQPYYKWAYRGLRDLSFCPDVELALNYLTESGNTKAEATTKREMIEDIAAIVIAEFHEQELTMATCNNLETHAYSIQDKITDNGLRNKHVMDGVD